MRDLVILTTHFGSNYSGGSLATHEIFRRLQDQFHVKIICTEVGQHAFQNVDFFLYRSWREALQLIRSMNPASIFYGDFYNSILYTFTDRRFYFTYHDNWPELRTTGFRNFIQSFAYMWAYGRIFRKAQQVVSVSEWKMKSIRRYTEKVTLIRNGFKTSDREKIKTNSKILMVGSVDDRKYRMLIRILTKYPHICDHGIDLFGRIVDLKIARRLGSFPDLYLKGFHEQVPYKSYKLLLHTSLMENLPLIFCEALAHQVPVVAFDVGGSAEVINEHNGTLVQPYDLQKMAIAVERRIAEPDKSVINTSILANFSWDTASVAYTKLLQS